MNDLELKHFEKLTRLEKRLLLAYNRDKHLSLVHCAMNWYVKRDLLIKATHDLQSKGYLKSKSGYVRTTYLKPKGKRAVKKILGGVWE